MKLDLAKNIADFNRHKACNSRLQITELSSFSPYGESTKMYNSLRKLPTTVAHRYNEVSRYRIRYSGVFVIARTPL